jgi:methyl-accepting chemotaxis protein
VKLPQLSIASKLYAIFALLATVTIGLAGVAVVNARHHVALTGEFEAALAGAQNVDRANGLTYAVMMEVRGIYLAADVKEANAIVERLLSLNDRIGAVVATWQTQLRADDSGQFSDFAGRVSEFQVFAAEIARLAESKGPAAARAWGDVGANHTMRARLNEDLEGLAAVYANRAGRLYAEIDRLIDQTAWLTSLLTIAAVLLAGAGIFTLRYAVARPLAKITRVTEEVAAGASQTGVPYAGRGDEIGALARSIAVFQDAMRRNEELNRLVVDDAQARAQRQELISAEIVRFGGEAEAAVAELARIAEAMMSASAQLSGAADVASQRTTGAASASEDASANVRDIASAADELAASVQEIDRQVAQSNAIAAKAVNETERTNAAVAELNEAAARIGDVVRLITDIAEQTNLLALNATIEAARAGDAGRGFAVVASEVKALAGETARATEEIGAQIAAMQHATKRSIEAIGAIGRTIGDIGEISSAIAAAVTEQGAATQEIARSVETAAQRTRETAGEVESVGEATEATRASASAVRSVADDLGQVSARIRSQVDAFFQKLRAA